MQFVVHPPDWSEGRWRTLSPRDALVLGFLFIVLLAALGIWQFATRFRCPKCGEVFGYYFGRRAARRLTRRRPQTCPSCGISLDEPMPEGPTNPIG
jgi:hypothetical protein